jgi:hypothetical protein
MTIRIRDLRNVNSSTPPLEALLGGKLAKADRIRSVHAQADSLLGNDRNVVARVGLQGSSAFQVTSVNPASVTQVYPLRTVYRTVARVPAFALLPGHFLRLSALCSPSGMTNKIVSDWVADGAMGEIAAVVTWTGPASDSTTHTVSIPASNETYAGEDTAAGSSWASLRRVEIPIMFPDSVGTSTADLRLWSEGVTAEIEIKYKGGVRVIDLVVQQVPLGYARDVGTDATSTYTSALTTNGQGQLAPNYASSHPIEERSATDPTYGSALLADIVHRQQTALGPVLAQWTAWDEATVAVTATDIPSVTTTSLTYVDMLRTSITAWASTNPGWSLSSGSMAQQFKSSNAKREMRGSNACVPVKVWVYGSRTAGTATLRFVSENYAVAEVTIISATPGWRSATGHLRCGAHPEDPSVLQVLGKTTSGTLSLSNILVEYLDL